ncbi:Coiled-coil domain-containing protein 56 [Akanthomyces lecanii RCEF 1005]|uniref:Cytochrome c oxidase assembly factor 3 n=1 Tax=Akanthomyces lecanii RCEF 1005 TaxID=1081108 RepID=A0A168HMY4_CORDF|nr:Coiled-coil domain-containing protein 56 [Akanthomyces lecanii RCEF 1005]
MSKDIARLTLNSNPHSTYYDGRLRQGPALIRARRPYLFKNAFTGLGLLAVVGGIYYYTLKAVGQDEFDDVKVPDVPRNATETK